MEEWDLEEKRWIHLHVRVSYLNINFPKVTLSEEELFILRWKGRYLKVQKCSTKMHVTQAKFQTQASCHCITLEKPCMVLSISFLIYKMGVMSPASQGHYEEQREMFLQGSQHILNPHKDCLLLLTVHPMDTD